MILLPPAQHKQIAGRVAALDNLQYMHTLMFGGTTPDGTQHPGIFIQPVGGWGDRAGHTVSNYLSRTSQNTQLGRDIAQLKRMEEGLLTLYARSVGSESDRVSDYDAKRIGALFPSVGFSGATLAESPSLPGHR